MTFSPLTTVVQGTSEGAWSGVAPLLGDISGAETLKTVFVIGCPRSGTTWVQAMLAAHPSMQSGPETHFFEAFAPVYDLFHIQQSGVLGRNVGLPAYLSTEQFNAWVRAAFWALVTANRTWQGEQSAYFLEKTPQHGLYADFILAVFPQARFIHVIRDARAVTASLLRASTSWGKNWAPKRADEAANFWQTQVEAARKIRTLVDAHQYYEVRYEDLRLAPQQQLGKLFEWLALAIEPAALAEIVANNAIDKSQRASEPFAAISTQPQQYPEGFIGAAPIHVEEFALTAYQRLQVEYEVGALLRQLGYPEVRSSFSLREKWLIGYALLQKYNEVGLLRLLWRRWQQHRTRTAAPADR